MLGKLIVDVEEAMSSPLLTQAPPLVLVLLDHRKQIAVQNGLGREVKKERPGDRALRSSPCHELNLPQGREVALNESRPPKRVRGLSDY
jgi:hypothetical protein